MEAFFIPLAFQSRYLVTIICRTCFELVFSEFWNKISKKTLIFIFILCHVIQFSMFDLKAAAYVID